MLDQNKQESADLKKNQESADILIPCEEEFVPFGQKSR